MGVWPPGVGLQGQASNRLMLLCLRDMVVSDEEKAAGKLSGVSNEDERKRTADEASKRVKMLSKWVDVDSTQISPDGTCLRPGWQPLYRRHELWTGFKMERGNLDRMGSCCQTPRYRDGATRSSEEAAVMVVERRSCVIQPEMWSQPA